MRPSDHGGRIFLLPACSIRPPVLRPPPALPNLTLSSSYPSSSSSSSSPPPPLIIRQARRARGEARRSGIRARPLAVARHAGQWPFGPAARTNPPPRCHRRRCRADRPQSTQGGMHPRATAGCGVARERGPPASSPLCPRKLKNKPGSSSYAPIHWQLRSRTQPR